MRCSVPKSQSELQATKLIFNFGTALLLFMGMLPSARSQEPANLASLHGTVRDSQGSPVVDARVELKSRDSNNVLETRTNQQGAYSFPNLRAGSYSLHVTAAYGDGEVASIVLEAKEAKNINMTLLVTKPAAQFFDTPQFTVSGVTDTTSLGGHGSDSIVRTRDSLAKETASLSNTPRKRADNAIAIEASLRERSDHQPYDFEANHQLGHLLAESGRSREAIPYLERADKANPSDYENLRELAFAEFDTGDYAGARATGLNLLNLQDRAEVHHFLGSVEERLGNPLESVRQYQRAAEMDPSEPYLFDWGSELLLHHAPEPAIEVFTKGNKRYPRSARMLMGLGTARFAQGSYDEAVERMCEASDLNPMDPAPYIFLGKMGSAEVSPSTILVEHLHRFVTLQPSNAEANYYYAAALWRQSPDPQDKARVAQVETLLNKAVSIDPALAAAYLQLGILHSAQQDDSRAISDYQRAAAADPQMEEPHLRLAQAYRRLGQEEKAKDELRLYEQLNKESAEKQVRERHEVQQFVYTLRDSAEPPVR